MTRTNCDGITLTVDPYLWYKENINYYKAKTIQVNKLEKLC